MDWNREPLMDTSSSGGGGMTKNDKVKLGLVGGLLVAATILIAWQFGIFGDGMESNPRPPEVQQELEEQAEIQRREAEEDPDAERGAT